MKAALFLQQYDVQIQDIPEPFPGDGEVKIKVGLCGICGTDAHIFSGDLNVAKPPVVLGHEVCGDIVALGSDVTFFDIGQRVAIDPVVTCGQCEYCHTGRTNMCRDQSVIGYVRNGGFAHYLTVPATHVYPLASSDFKRGILVETLACVLNGYDRLQFRAGHSAMILGAGTVGLLWNQMLKDSPVTTLLQTELIPYRREKAKKIGADFVFDGADPNLPGAIAEICPEGLDYIIDATGDPAAVEAAIPWVAKEGTFMIFGVCPQDSKVRISPFEIYEREIKIIASKMPPGTLDRSARLLSSGAIDVDEIVTTVWPLNRIDEAFDLFFRRKDTSIKIAIDPWSDS